MASLIPMPAWVVAQINSLVFSFFGSCKKDLVARKVVYHFHLCGGFNVVFIQFKCTLFWLSGFAVLLLPQMRGLT